LVPEIPSSKPSINPPLRSNNKRKGASLYTKTEKILQLTLALKRQLQTTTFLMFFKAHRGAFLTNLSKTMNQRELEKFLNNYSMTLNYYLPIIFLLLGGEGVLGWDGSWFLERPEFLRVQKYSNFQGFL
jgi:hypothetical protein